MPYRSGPQTRMTAPPHRRAGYLFVLLSGADLALTCALLRHPAGGHYEANWLAHSALARFGFTGLAAYKGLTVLLAGLLVNLLARSRPAAARRLGAFACLAVGAVVLYSAALLVRQPARPANAMAKDLATVRRESQALSRAVLRQGAFDAALARWRTGLAAGRCTLDEAVRDLSGYEARERSVQAIRAGFGSPGSSDAECLAAMVVGGAVGELREAGSDAARGRAGRLLTAYHSAYGAALLRYVHTLSEPPPGAVRGLGQPSRWASRAAPVRSPSRRVPGGALQGG
jgi:Domain of unknown function (DUF5658)